MLDELKSKLKELAELRRDIQVSDEYIAERKAEYEATDAYKSYTKAKWSREELVVQERQLSLATQKDISAYLKTIGLKVHPIDIALVDLSQYLDGG